MAALVQLKSKARPEAFLPVSLAEARARGWEQLDVVKKIASTH